MMQKPTIIDAYDLLWERFKTAYHGAAKAAEAIRADEQALTGGNCYLGAFRWDPTSIRNNLDQTVDSLILKLVGMAEKHLPPTGARLSIPHDRVRDLWWVGDSRHNRELHRDFSPSAVWDKLVETYGGTRAAAVAFAQAANVLVDYYDLHKLPDIKRSAGAVELDSTIYTETPYGIGPGLREIRYRDRERLSEVVAALRSFLAWAGDDGTSPTAIGLDVFVRDYVGHHNGRFTSRTRAGAGEVQFILYFQKMTTRLSFGLAEKLNEFVGLYSTALQAALSAAAERQADSGEMEHGSGF